MKLPLFGLPRGVLPALCLAAASVLVSAGRAEATCGDYVHLGGHAPHHVDMSSPAHGDRSDPSEKPAGEKRCTGPFCSNGAPRPQGLPEAPVTVVERQPGLLADSEVPPLCEGQFRLHQNEAPSPRIFSSAIFRPPR